jgi:TolA-binding protein
MGRNITISKVIVLVILLAILAGFLQAQTDKTIVSTQRAKVNSDSTVTIVSSDEIQRIETARDERIQRMQDRIDALERRVVNLEQEIKQ